MDSEGRNAAILWKSPGSTFHSRPFNRSTVTAQAIDISSGAQHFGIQASDEEEEIEVSSENEGDEGFPKLSVPKYRKNHAQKKRLRTRQNAEKVDDAALEKTQATFN